jgi:hypothetical protein
MAGDSRDPRDAIHEAIQEHAPAGQDALLTGWALVAEWIDPEGERWLSKAHASSTTSWGAKGMYHEALNGDWPAEGDDAGQDS